jgi:hypothetical protein
VENGVESSLTDDVVVLGHIEFPLGPDVFLGSLLVQMSCITSEIGTDLG